MAFVKKKFYILLKNMIQIVIKYEFPLYWAFHILFQGKSGF